LWLRLWLWLWLWLPGAATRREYLDRFYRCQRKRNSLLRVHAALRRVSSGDGSGNGELAEAVLAATAQLEHLQASSTRVCGVAPVWGGEVGGGRWLRRVGGL
jgi:hypothetical protein